MASPSTATSRLAPVGAGIVTMALIWWIAGSTLQRVPVVPDEAAYLLQARLFAHGHWTAAARPIPEFFEQLYVIVTPFLASKYPPGQSLMLVPGIWLGTPLLMPILLSGLAGALIFALSRRVAGPWVALLALLLWLSSYMHVYWRATYMSEVTTSAFWLLAWWALDRWRQRGATDTRYLVLTAVSVGVVAITRPFTAVALALPVIAVVLWTAWPARRWRPVAIAAAAGTAVVAILPLWNVASTGDWRESPLALYTGQYMPFDGPGFGIGTTLPSRRMPPDMARGTAPFFALHRDYLPATVPGALIARLRFIGRDVWESRWYLAPFALGALIVTTAEGWFALGSLALLVVLYLLYPHPPFYTIYYQEAEPVLFFLTGLGLVRAAQLLARRRAWMVCAALAVGGMAMVYPVVKILRAQDAQDERFYTRARALFDAAPATRAIIFVRYMPTHHDGLPLIRNEADLASASRWVVYDRGDADTALMRLAPDRTPYLFDEIRWKLIPMANSPRVADTTR